MHLKGLLFPQKQAEERRILKTCEPKGSGGSVRSPSKSIALLAVGGSAAGCPGA